MNKDKKMIERVLNHALEIIFLLTGEEYTLVKKNSSDHLSGEYDIDRLKEIMDESRKPFGTLGFPAMKNSDLQDENVDLASGDDEDRLNEKDILQVTMHSDLGAELSDENLYTVSINEEGEYEREEKDILRFKIQPGPCVGTAKGESSIFPKLSRDGLNVTCHRQVKKEKNDSDGKRFSFPAVGSSKKFKTEDHTPECSSAIMLEDEVSPSNRVHEENLETALSEKENSASNSECDEKSDVLHKTPVKDAATCSAESDKKTADDSKIDGVEVSGELQMLGIGEKPYVCPDCEKTFTKRSHLIQHHRTHTGEKPYGCFACEKRFNTRTHLVIHQRTHTGEKPYTCPECGKCFSQRSSMVNHHRIHTGEKPYVCQICEKGFYRRSDMDKHQRTHTGVKPFVCPVCGKCFYLRADLVKHHRTHTGEKPFVCTDCGKGFSERSNLAKHGKIHKK